ncbi:MAG: hypothetical protein VYE22_15925 [Myxococcota bacterium]|nr:hypothetical protein [Myxococcota bacterium]
MRRLRHVALLSLLASLVAAGAAAQFESSGAGAGLGAELDEARAWDEAEQGHHIKARELAEAILRDRPDSFVGHFVLGWVHHYGEANFARALYHHDRAYALFVREHGEEPVPPAPWRWHARLMRELAMTHGDLEHYDQQLEWMLRYSDLYEPDFIAERAWPLMKLRRFDDAREAAQLGRLSGDPRQEELALNALCAIEFEAGDDQASYQACRAAMELHGANPQLQGAVDFTNFAEAARSVFRLDEAERVGLLATEARVSWYGNPWVELGELYVREGRFAEALHALKQVPEYRQRRPPHVREADRNEGRRALSSFYLVVGRADEALEIAQKALDAPDRRAHISRDPQQDRAIAALLHRASLRLRAERRAEDNLGEAWYTRLWGFFENLADRGRAAFSGRIAARNLADDERLIGTFLIGTHRSAVMPPWLAGELVDVLGAGVVEEAVARARAEDDREGSDAYYDAFAAEAALDRGDTAEADRLAASALAALNPAEAMLRARTLAIRAEAARQDDDVPRATRAYGEAFQVDPGVFRRMGFVVPVRYEVRGGGFAEDLADVVDDSPRFSTEDWGLRVEVEGDRSRARICLRDGGGAVLGCAEGDASAEGEDADEFAARLVRDFHQQAFAPRVDLSQSDVSSLDGSNRVSRDPLRTLFGHEPPPRDE